MLYNLFVLAFFIFQIDNGPRITSPVDGEVLKDTIPITGITSIDGFQSAELSFTYAMEPIENWFVITSMVDPVAEGLLAEWDTKPITDGDYHLRLQVYSQDGSTKEFLVRDLRIRNYSALPAEPSSTEEAAVTEALSMTQDPTQTENVAPSLASIVTPPISSPSPFPANPATLDRSTVFSIVRASIFVTLLVFGALALWLRSRRNE